MVETKSSEDPERSFTYKQICEASNILAHYLSDAGITNGDVVMIWAHRSVDLVISIMGTGMEFPACVSFLYPEQVKYLTFLLLGFWCHISVLDPAYPPARQTIYLEVAQPRLVQGQRMSQGNWPQQCEGISRRSFN